MPYGYNGKVLRVNLSDATIADEEPGEVFYRTYFGGRNFIAHYLLNETKPGIDPLGPENKLIFATGVITGSPVGGTGRNSVGAKSPLTGGYGDGEAGGYFGSALKHAGYDAIIFEGQSATPVYLLIGDGKAELRDASHLWGKTTGDAEAILKDEMGEKVLRTAMIGPAGENLVRYACVLNDISRAAGRTGMGAVMGSKKLKAVVARGKNPPPLADPARVRELSKWMVEHWKDHAFHFHDTGTAGTLPSHDRAGNLPTFNFREGTFAGADKISGQVLRDTVLTGRGSCYACPVRCKREVKVGPPWNVDPKYGGPEYESLGALGSNCGIDDLLALCKANELGAAYGYDTISAGCTIAFAMECFERGLLTEKDTDGVAFTFGNTQAMLWAVEALTYRRGFGDLLAEGVRVMAERIGGPAKDYAVVVKGQELPMHEPRCKPGLGVGYTISATGADHNHNIHDTLYQKPNLNLTRANEFGIVEPMSQDELSDAKMRLLAYDGTWRTVINTFLCCQFLPWLPSQMSEVINGVTGWNTTVFELEKVGERAITLPRIYNLREGFTAADDKLPPRIYEPHTQGARAGFQLDEAEVEAAKRKYYGMMGWDENGVPTASKLAELNIAWAADHLPK